MATIYSLICFGGKDGKTVTFTDAGDVVNLTNHGLRDGTGVVFTDNAGNTLPTGLSKNTTYYAKQGADSGKFTLWTTDALTTQVTFTGTGTGTHKVKSAYYVGLSDKSRWTYGGVEQIYDGLATWNTGRAGATVFDTEVCEIGMAWDDIYVGQLVLSVPAAATAITTMVSGARSAGYHGGIVGEGYKFMRKQDGNGTVLALAARYHQVVDGFTIGQSGAYGTVSLFGFGGKLDVVAQNMIFHGKNLGAGANATGHTLNAGESALNNLYIECNACVVPVRYAIGFVVAGCTMTKSDTGVSGAGYTSPFYGFWYNNIAIGNATNWGNLTGGFEGAGGNGGLAGDYTFDTTATKFTIATTDFADYANNDFRAAAITSPQVEQGVQFYGVSTGDIADAVRPAYPGSLYNTAVTAGSFVAGLSYTIVSLGTTDFTAIGASVNTVGITFKAAGAGSGTGTATLNAKPDAGAYEFDLGYGAWPTSRTLDFSGLVAGSQVVIYTTNTTTELDRDDSTGTTHSFDAAASGVTVDYTILKAGYKPIRVTGVALTATSTPVVVQQDLDRAYATPSGLTFGTNVIVNVTARVVTSMQITAASTVQNWYSYLMDSWIASATNTTLKNVAFPVIPFGEASFTTLSGIEFSDGATSISKFKRDGLRYSSDAGVTATAIWAAVLTLNTPAGQQVKYRQAPAGAITNAANTGPMDQLVQVYGDASHGNFDYRGHMVLRAPKVGWSQPQPDLVATYGNLVDGLFVAALEPLLQYATTDADIDAANLALDNTAKTYTITAAHTMAELYQRAQWWANQDAQWDADIPLTTTDGSTFTQPSAWAMTGVSYLTAGTLAGGTATLAAGTQGIAYSGATLIMGAAGTYTFTMAGSCLVKVTPTAPSTYIFGSGTFNGTLTVNNMATHAITVEIPAGVTTSTAGNTGGAITFSAPVVRTYATATVLADSRVRLTKTVAGVETEVDNVFVAGTAYSVELTAAGIADGTTMTLYVCKLGHEEVKVQGLYNAATGIAFLVAQGVDTIYTAWGIDGSAVTEFAPDYTGHIYIESNDADGVSMKKRLGAYYSHLLTTEGGIRYYFGALTFLSTAAIRVNTAVTDLLIENINPDTALRFSDVDVRLYRDDGTSIIAPSSYSIHNDYNGVPDVVETGVSGLTGAESSQLMGLPSAAGTASAVRTNLTPELAAIADIDIKTDALANLDAPVSSRLPTAAYLAPDNAGIAGLPAAVLDAAQVAGGMHADMRKTNGIGIHGNGSETDKFRSVLVP